MMYELIGYFAAILTTLSFLPQALRIIRTKDTYSISFKMYVMFVSGVFCWLIYGISIENIQIIIANFITLLLSGSILIMKVKDMKKANKVKK